MNQTNQQVHWTIFESPVGVLSLVAGPDGLTDLSFPGRLRLPPEAQKRPIPAVEEQLDAYFAGELREFELRLDVRVGTPLQRQVWRRLLEIPYGETISYGELARRIGRPHASRAVGLANGRNPISIVVPCHRVIGASGSLTGYGGGIERKRLLLELEAGVPSLLA